MRCYVPSQVIELLDRRLPSVRRQCEQNQPGLEIGYPHRAAVALLVRMLDGISEHLLPLRGNDAIDFAEAIEAIRHIVGRWQSGEQLLLIRPVPQGPLLNPVSVVWKLLANLPDEAAGEASHDLAFIADLELREGLARDLKATEEAIDRRAWKAATVLGGSVAEALLLGALLPMKAEALQKAASIQPPIKKDLHDWSLCDLTRVAESLGVIDQSTAAECQVARGFRNLIHPGRELRLSLPCDRGTAFATMAAVDHVSRDLRRRAS